MTTATTEAEYDAEGGTASRQPRRRTALPEGFEVKGNKGSMKFHGPPEPVVRPTNAEVWFRTAEAAEAAGLVTARPRARRRPTRRPRPDPLIRSTGGPARRGGATVRSPGVTWTTEMFKEEGHDHVELHCC